MERITEAMLKHMFARFIRTGITAGVLDPEAKYVLDGGNDTYGYQYRIRNFDNSHSVLTTGQGGLGTTKRQAYDRLQAACQALDMVIDHRGPFVP
jgi:hypothetical protein